MKIFRVLSALLVSSCLVFALPTWAQQVNAGGAVGSTNMSHAKNINQVRTYLRSTYARRGRNQDRPLMGRGSPGSNSHHRSIPPLQRSSQR